MSELRDWCISRQLWWGHRIPVFYCNDCGYEFATEEEEPKSCPKCGSSNLTQDPDVLDTWFSSGLWPFSTLGWGNGEFGKGTLWQEDDLKNFYPNSMLITGFDILFFWVARMMFMGVHVMREVPFRDIYLHALVRDEHGQKMSKSRGNVIDPLDMVKEFNADTLRFTLAALAVQGRDIRLSVEKLGLYRNFTNKIYNASRYLLLKQEKFDDLKDIEVKTPLGNYMLGRFYKAVKDVRENIDSYRFNDAAMSLYKYFWNDFCDWGIELSKADSEAVSELGAIFKESLKLLHPFMPFISEHLYHELSGTKLEESNSIMVMKYPKIKDIDTNIQEIFNTVIEIIVSIRRAKATIELGNKEIEKAYIKLDKDIDISQAEKYIKRLARVKNIEKVESKPEDCVSDISDNLETFIPLKGIDLTPIIKRLEKQKEKLEKEYNKLNSMLSNERFVANAPKNVVEENKKNFEEVKERLEKVKSELNTLQ